MIAIVNVSEDFGVEYGKGLQHYEVRLNRIVLSEFTHFFEDGMVVCLQKATDSLVDVDIDARVREYRLQELFKAPCLMEGRYF